MPQIAVAGKPRKLKITKDGTIADEAGGVVSPEGLSPQEREDLIGGTPATVVPVKDGPGTYGGKGVDVIPRVQTPEQYLAEQTKAAAPAASPTPDEAFKATIAPLLAKTPTYTGAQVDAGKGGWNKTFTDLGNSRFVDASQLGDLARQGDHAAASAALRRAIEDNRRMFLPMGGAGPYSAEDDAKARQQVAEQFMQTMGLGVKRTDQETERAKAGILEFGEKVAKEKDRQKDIKVEEMRGQSNREVAEIGRKGAMTGNVMQGIINASGGDPDKLNQAMKTMPTLIRQAEEMYRTTGGTATGTQKEIQDEVDRQTAETKSLNDAKAFLEEVGLGTKPGTLKIDDLVKKIRINPSLAKHPIVIEALNKGGGGMSPQQIRESIARQYIQDAHIAGAFTPGGWRDVSADRSIDGLQTHFREGARPGTYTYGLTDPEDNSTIYAMDDLHLPGRMQSPIHKMFPWDILDSTRQERAQRRSALGDLLVGIHRAGKRAKK